jgi:hypothetical protein
MNSFQRMRPGALASLALLLVLGLSGPVTAGWFWGHAHRGPDPSEGYAVPIQCVYQFPAAFVMQPGARLFGDGSAAACCPGRGYQALTPSYDGNEGRMLPAAGTAIVPIGTVPGWTPPFLP